MIPSRLFALLERMNLSLKKSFSQNFLIDPNIGKKIVSLAEICLEDQILEIGPGLGALTEHLLQTKAPLFAIEKDKRFIDYLQTLPALHLFHADALTFPIETLPITKVVANLPYAISTPLLERFCTLQIPSMTLMVQKEFSQRLLAKPCDPSYGPLSILTSFYTSCKSHFPVSRHCFYPPPQVESVVIRLDAHPPPLSHPEPFFRLIKKAFQQRRKKLTTSLKGLFEQNTLEKALDALSIRRDARPEMLDLDQWLALYDRIEKN